MPPSYLARGWELANGVLTFAMAYHLKFCSVEITGVVGLATYLPQLPTPTLHLKQHVADLWAGQFETMLEKTIPVILGVVHLISVPHSSLSLSPSGCSPPDVVSALTAGQSDSS